MPVRPGLRFVQIAVAAAVASLVVAGAATRAEAELSNAPIDLQMFRSAMDSKGFITLNSSGGLGLGELSFGLVTTWASRPLQLQSGMVGGQPIKFGVNDLVTASLQAAVGFTKLPHLGIELGIAVPMSLLAGRGDPT